MFCMTFLVQPTLFQHSTNCEPGYIDVIVVMKKISYVLLTHARVSIQLVLQGQPYVLYHFPGSTCSLARSVDRAMSKYV